MNGESTKKPEKIVYESDFNGQDGLNYISKGY